jgi:hypothetical protein
MTQTTSLARERLSDEFPAYRVDVSHELPDGWQDEITRCSRAHSDRRTLCGRASTSRESVFPERSIAEVGVVPGTVVRQQLRWLDELYRGRFLALANSLSTQRYRVSPDPRAGLNINTTRRATRYEWHVDSNPLTGLLFATTLPPEAGGQLVFRPDPATRPGEDWEVTISPRAGELLLFDARHAVHGVTTLRAEERISVPMNYYVADEPVERPQDLDTYLYQ